MALGGLAKGADENTAEPVRLSNGIERHPDTAVHPTFGPSGLRAGRTQTSLEPNSYTDQLSPATTPTKNVGAWGFGLFRVHYSEGC